MKGTGSETMKTAKVRKTAEISLPPILDGTISP
jgi:hypothetical protein